MLVADSKPFPDLHKIIIDLNETRAWVFAEWVSTKRSTPTLHQNNNFSFFKIFFHQNFQKKKTHSHTF